jgi:hypothetical protein
MGHYLSEMLHPEPLEEELNVITIRRHWGVYKRYNYRSLRNFKHRDLAFLYAVRYAKNRNVRIIVHDKNGCVDFTYNNMKDGK